MDYARKNHSKYRLVAHVIFSVKYRKNLLDLYGLKIKEILMDISKCNDFTISSMEVDKVHIHLLIEYPPKQSVLSIVRLLKQISTYRIWRQNDNYINLRRHFWEERTFWSDGYFACSVGTSKESVVKKYIENQG